MEVGRATEHSVSQVPGSLPLHLELLKEVIRHSCPIGNKLPDGADASLSPETLSREQHQHALRSDSSRAQRAGGRVRADLPPWSRNYCVSSFVSAAERRAGLVPTLRHAVRDCD